MSEQACADKGNAAGRDVECVEAQDDEVGEREAGEQEDDGGDYNEHGE